MELHRGNFKRILRRRTPVVTATEILTTRCVFNDSLNTGKKYSYTVSAADIVVEGKLNNGVLFQCIIKETGDFNSVEVIAPDEKI